MKKFLAGYVTGIVTAPAVYFVFRKPLIRHIVVPVSAKTIMNEDMDEALFNLMSIRLDFQESRKKHGKTVHQLKAQGHSVPKIAEMMDMTEKQVRLLLLSGNPEE